MSLPSCKTCKSYTSCKKQGIRFKCIINRKKYYEPARNTVIDISGRRFVEKACEDNVLQSTVNIPITINLSEKEIKEWIKQCPDPNVLHDLAQTAINAAKLIKKA